jgi:hypothetical protein
MQEVPPVLRLSLQPCLLHLLQVQAHLPARLQAPLLWIQLAAAVPLPLLLLSQTPPSASASWL